jgi:hypothetical protein
MDRVLEDELRLFGFGLGRAGALERPKRNNEKNKDTQRRIWDRLEVRAREIGSGTYVVEEESSAVPDPPVVLSPHKTNRVQLFDFRMWVHEE